MEMKNLLRTIKDRWKSRKMPVITDERDFSDIYRIDKWLGDKYVVQRQTCESWWTNWTDVVDTEEEAQKLLDLIIEANKKLQSIEEPVNERDRKETSIGSDRDKTVEE